MVVAGMEVEKLLTAVVTILIGVIGVATLAALVSNKSNTPSVIGAVSGGFACDLYTAMTGSTKLCSGIKTGSVTSTGGGTSVDSGIKFPPPGCTTFDCSNRAL